MLCFLLSRLPLVVPPLEYRPHCGLVMLCFKAPQEKHEKIKISSFEMGLGVRHFRLFPKELKAKNNVCKSSKCSLRANRNYIIYGTQSYSCDRAPTLYSGDIIVLKLYNCSNKPVSGSQEQLVSAHCSVFSV